MALTLAQYARHDALGLAELVARKAVTPKELAATAMRAIEAVNPAVNAVVETYDDRIAGLDEATLGPGPFRGVPTLMKDVFGHEGGRRIEFGSRLCAGMKADRDSHFCALMKQAGLNIVGRSAAPEYSMSGSTEGALYGNTSNPWRRGYSAGGSTGGGQAAVTAGIVALAHGSDIGGSIRIPASWCGGVGLKPSRGRISFGPALDENGFGLASNFVQVKSVRDAAAMLDCLAVPQVGDPFAIPRPAERYAALARARPGRLRIGLTLSPLLGVAIDAEVAAAVRETGKLLAGMGHEVVEQELDMGGLESVKRFMDLWYFGLDVRLDGYGARTGRKPGPDTLEPMVLAAYEHARRMKAADFFAALGEVNAMRRKLSRFWQTADVMLTPTSARVAEPWGNYNLGRTDVAFADMAARLYAVPCQHTLPHNIMGTPAISLPLAMHGAGLPIGVQLAGPPATEHVLLQLAAALEEASPWAARVPPLHVSRT